jgi:hypothetical protein
MSKSDSKGRYETANRNYNVENVPTIGLEAAPTQTVASNRDIDDVYGYDYEEKIILEE